MSAFNYKVFYADFLERCLVYLVDLFYFFLFGFVLGESVEWSGVVVLLRELAVGLGQYILVRHGRIL